jgi:lipid II:glycine glycyltransferase (peptidoglycan interpeptide bridge formation enzyme)
VNSFFYTDAWRKAMKISSGWVYHTAVPYIGKITDMHFSHLSFTIVDKNYALIDDLVAKKTYKMLIDVQDCPEHLRHKLVSQGFKVREWATYIIDLTKAEEELFANIKKESRKLIRRTKEQTTVHECSTEEEYLEYYNLLLASRKGMKTSSKQEALHMWRTMHPTNYTVLYVRDKQGNMLAAMGIFFTKDYMKEVAAARSELSKEQHIYANELLKWEFILWGKNKGIQYYDLAGFNPQAAPGSKEDNIRRFKEKWGGVIHEWLFFEKHGEQGLLGRAVQKVERVMKK